MDYFGRCLVATAVGRSAVLYASFKGGITSIRDNLIALQLGVMPTMTDWEADPYGYQFDDEPSESFSGLRGFRYRLPENLRLMNRSESVEYDGQFSDHPLSRVRKFISVAPKVLKCTYPPADERPTLPANLSFDYTPPTGFVALPEGELSDGVIYRRISYDAQQTHFAVCRHPEAPDCGRSKEAAMRLALEHIEMSQGHVYWGPEVRSETIGGQDGFVVEIESALHGRDVTSFEFFFPLGADSLEVSGIAEIGDRDRAERLVREVLSTFRSG